MMGWYSFVSVCIPGIISIAIQFCKLSDKVLLVFRIFHEIAAYLMNILPTIILFLDSTEFEGIVGFFISWFWEVLSFHESKCRYDMNDTSPKARRMRREYTAFSSSRRRVTINRPSSKPGTPPLAACRSNAQTRQHFTFSNKRYLFLFDFS